MGLFDFLKKNDEGVETPETTEDKKKKIKYYTIGAGVILFFLIFALMSQTGKQDYSRRQGRRNNASIENPLENVDIAKEEWTLKSAARIRALEEQTVMQEKRIKKLETQNKMLMDSIRSVAQAIRTLSDAVYKLKDNILNTPLPAPTPTPTKAAGGFNKTPGQNYYTPPQPQKKESSIKIIGPTGKKENQDTVQTATALQPMQKPKKVILPAGSFARVVFLAGVFAPCSNQDVPVLMKVITPAITPKDRRNFVGSFIIGSAIGDESSKSALIRLQKIAFVYKDSVIVRPAKGWVVGPDGKYGIRGRVFDRSGKYIAYALLAGFASGVGSAVQGAYTEITQNPFGQTTYKVDNKQIAKVAAASGAANAANTLSDYFMKKANKLVPVVELPAGTIADVVFLDDLTI